MMTQGVLSFQYKEDKILPGLTNFGGIGPYLDLAFKLNLPKSIDKHIHLRTGGQGWTDRQIILSLIFLNILGGNFVEDINHLEHDEGLRRLWESAINHLPTPSQRIKNKKRWRKKRERVFPSPTAIFSYLHLLVDQSKVGGKDGISSASDLVQSTQCFLHLNKVFLKQIQKYSPCEIATIDQDATLVPTYKNNAAYCYKHFQAFQPLNTYWFEQDLLIHTEFRHGNVPAGFEELRVFEEALKQLPAGVKKVYLRTDGAGYQWELMDYCELGKNKRFGRIEFAISAEVSPGFKKAALEMEESKWSPICKTDEYDNSVDTGNEWIKLFYVPYRTFRYPEKPEYHFYAVREKYHEDGSEKLDSELPFPTITSKQTGKRYKLFGVITNRNIPGDELILWHRERCGKSEEVHLIQKSDLAGGHLPSKHFAVNSAWWLIMVIAYNLSSAMKKLILDDDFKKSRLKSIRFNIINNIARVVNHSRKLIIQLSDGIDLIINMRRKVLLLGQAPP